MAQTVAIAGAGIAGRLLALELAQRGWQVSLFDKDDEQGTRSCTWAGAGMIAPSSELETADHHVAILGTSALSCWPDTLRRLDEPVYFRQDGSLIVAHPNDRADLRCLQQKIEARAVSPDVMQALGAEEIHELEPELDQQFEEGLYLPGEAHLDNRQLMTSLAVTLKNRGVQWTTRAEVTLLQPHQLCVAGEYRSFDWVVDCRGLGAQSDLKTLRGVRGELVRVFAPEVGLRRPVRLVHPRYRVYIVPREDHVYVIGATSIESEDYSPITVRSTLELLSAAYTVHTGFAEARLLETVTHCRPAFSDNRPRVLCEDGLVRINGLYRHGFLVSPALIQSARRYLEQEPIEQDKEVLEMGRT